MPHTLRLGSSRKARKQTKLRDGEIMFFAPRVVAATARLLIDALPESVPGRVLTGLTSQPVVAMAAKCLWPEVEVTFFHYDVYHTSSATVTLEQNELEVSVITEADVPDGPFHLALLSFDYHSEWQLVRDNLERVALSLAPGGTLLCATDNPKDSKLTQELQQIFGGVKLEEKTRDGRLYSCRRKGNPNVKGHGYRHSVTARFGDAEYQFVTRPGVFSHAKFDEGARALIDEAEYQPGDSLLDLGSGYGSVGIVMSDRLEGGKVTMVDSNARAVALARENILLNNISNTEVILSAEVETGNGYFDRVLANPPYFSNYRISELFICRSHEILKPGGTFQLVTKSPAPHIAMLDRVFRNSEQTSRRGYSIVKSTK